MCDNCGKVTTNPRFCSRSCAAAVTNKETRRRVSKWKCTECGSAENRASSGSKVCKDCKPDIDHTMGFIRQGYSHRARSSRHSVVNARARALLRKLGRTVCEWENCGWSFGVQAAHIKPSSSFDDTARLSEVNSPYNLRALCPNHHWLFDHTPSYLSGSESLSSKQVAESSNLSEGTI